MDKKTDAIDIFNSGYNCCQAILSAYTEDLGMDKDLALKIGTGFGGGMRNGEVCGAVSGAIIALGLKYGHYIKSDTESKSKCYELTKKFTKEFEERNGSIICKKLLGYDLSDKEQYEAIISAGLFKNICPALIGSAIEILDDIL